MPAGSTSVSVCVSIAAAALVFPNEILIWLVSPVAIAAGVNVIPDTVGACPMAAKARTSRTTAQPMIASRREAGTTRARLLGIDFSLVLISTSLRV
jgi:hypothetical protein